MDMGALCVPRTEVSLRAEHLGCLLSLADDLDARPHRSVDLMLEHFDRADRDAVLRALTDRKPNGYFRWPAPALAARLAEDGITVTVRQVEKWRAKNVPR